VPLTVMVGRQPIPEVPDLATEQRAPAVADQLTRGAQADRPRPQTGGGPARLPACHRGKGVLPTLMAKAG
ncbi:hypothetical protein HMPREF0072_0578, partial [Anaerococcus lactolyticus ATCC 51172]